LSHSSLLPPIRFANRYLSGSLTFLYTRCLHPRMENALIGLNGITWLFTMIILSKQHNRVVRKGKRKFMYCPRSLSRAARWSMWRGCCSTENIRAWTGRRKPLQRLCYRNSEVGIYCFFVTLYANTPVPYRRS